MKKKKINKSKNSSSNKVTPKSILTKKILSYYENNNGKPMGVSAILRKLNSNASAEVLSILDELTSSKFLTKVSPGKYALNQNGVIGKSRKSETVSGIIDMASGGFGYLLVNGSAKDVFIAAPNLKSAQDGDLVEVKIINHSIRRPEGVVLTVLERARTQCVGIYRVFKNQRYVMSQYKSQTQEIFIDEKKSIAAEDHDRVVVEILEWKENAGGRMMGKITRNFGKESSSDIEMQTILAEQGFNLEFSRAALEEAKNMSDKITDENTRRDYRNICTFTIDPIDAKDFDDALSVRRDEENNIEIGVHIADVSYYVKENSALDKEALKKGNSVYLVDRVSPMLPERLSNELCSLRPREDKATFAVIFTLDGDKKIIKHWIGRTIIHSQRRFTYEEVQAILNAGEGELHAELHLLDQTAKQIRVERLKNGAIDFESEEVRFKLDENKMPIELYVKERLDAHMLIEEYMLLANKYVATYMAKKRKENPLPFVYRIHDVPDKDKLEEFAEFAREMGLVLDFGSRKKISKSLNLLAEKARQDSSFKVLQSLAIRTMAKAAYSPDNIGHYGLAFDYYTHFTSPIRRYSDLIVHRILWDNLSSEKKYAYDILNRQCTHISSQERKAMIAERESTKYFQVVFLKEKVGQEFDATVTGMNGKNIFVEMSENRCEAMIPFELMEEEVELNKNRLSVQVGFKSKPIRMGDAVRIKITHIDIDDKEVIGVLVKQKK